MIKIISKRKCATHTTEYCAAIKGRNPTICNNMDGPWRHYAKWNESDIRMINTIWSRLHVESKRRRKHSYKEQIGDCQRQGVGGGQMGEGG